MLYGLSSNLEYKLVRGPQGSLYFPCYLGSATVPIVYPKYISDMKNIPKDMKF